MPPKRWVLLIKERKSFFQITKQTVWKDYTWNLIWRISLTNISPWVSGMTTWIMFRYLRFIKKKGHPPQPSVCWEVVQFLHFKNFGNATSWRPEGIGTGMSGSGLRVVISG